MPGAPISRWTMAYFSASLIFLIGALAAMGSGVGLPSDIGAPETLALVHVLAIGWLGLLFCGALLQFVPVLATTDLRIPWLAAPALLSLTLGLAALVAGFLALAGDVDLDPVIMSAGGSLLALGFACLIASLGATIIAGKAVTVSGVLVLGGLFALLATIASGNVFAGLLAGLFDSPRLWAHLTDLVSYHAASGLLGWMSVTAIGVSYQLFSMFMLAPERAISRKPVIVVALSALAIFYFAFALGAFDTELVLWSRTISVVAAAGLLAIYLGNVWRMFRSRRRKVLELNTLASLVAVGFLALGMTMLAASVVLETSQPLAVTAFYLLGMGWLSGLGLAQLYKIVPFLTWLEVYGPVMGRHQVPRVQDLVDEAGAAIWFVVFYMSVLTAGAAILADFTMLFRVATWCQCAAVAALALEYLRARRLAYAAQQLPLPSGVRRPHIIYAATSSKE